MSGLERVNLETRRLLYVDKTVPAKDFRIGVTEHKPTKSREITMQSESPLWLLEPWRRTAGPDNDS